MVYLFDHCSFFFASGSDVKRGQKRLERLVKDHIPGVIFVLKASTNQYIVVKHFRDGFNDFPRGLGLGRSLGHVGFC